MFFHIISLLVIFSFFLTAQVDRTNALININDMAFWVSNNGMMGRNPDGRSGGLYTEDRFPVIFVDGIVWGGYVNDQKDNQDLRLGGSTFSAGTQAGWIENGMATNPQNSRIYKIRKEWKTLKHEDLIREAADFYNVETYSVTKEMTSALIKQYLVDWYEWPGGRGAPFHDLNKNGRYDPETDIAGLLDADQVVWFVVNDYNRELTENLFGSRPIGLEVQYTLWAYKSTKRLGQFIYKRVTLINRSQNLLQDFYISQFSDPDLGNFSNDVVGCDSMASLMFCYNGSTDWQHNIDPPMAVGYKILQGPSIPSPGDSALLNLEWKQNRKNLSASSFGYAGAGCNLPGDNINPHGNNTYQIWYNMLRGYKAYGDILNPTPFINPHTGSRTKFPLHGDPVTRSGDIDGKVPNCPPGDRRMWINCGPFNMAPGDTQEVIFAVIGGLSDDYTEAINNIKSNMQAAELYYYDNIKDFRPSLDIPAYNPPFKFIFQRPYPNPFNPTVNFNYEIAEAGLVKINVYNILGQKVKVLFNDDADVGLNIFSWDASSFAAGVYIIQIRYKSYSLSQKVLLLK